MEFAELELIPPLLRALEEEGYLRPTPIQEQAIPPVLRGRDVLGCAQTGTGKTAAFALPILQRLHESGGTRRGRVPIRVLILTPTRELASQINESFVTYGRHLPLTSTVIFGGVGQLAQTKALGRGVDVLVATPGRLLDLHGQGLVGFDRLEVFVLDEADRMLDMGFIHDVKRVIATLPPRRQTLLFSATMPADIQQLAATILHEPARVAVAPPATTVELVEQSVYFVEKADKRLLLERLLEDREISRALVFTRTKHGANRVVDHLVRRGFGAHAIHGNKSQGARERALEAFKQGETRVLVATDIAARGIDIDDVSHVINFDVPNIPETYVHRIGRTARAGASGIALSFCQQDERPYLVDIQRLIGQVIPVVEDHPCVSPLGTPSAPDLRPGGGKRRQEPPPPARPARSRAAGRPARAAGPRAPREPAPREREAGTETPRRTRPSRERAAEPPTSSAQPDRPPEAAPARRRRRRPRRRSGPQPS